MVTGNVYDVNNKIESTITEALKKIPNEDLKVGLNFSILKNYNGSGTEIDNKKTQEAICRQYNIALLPGNIPQNLNIISSANLPGTEKSWLYSYERDPKFVLVSEEKRAELSPAIARAKLEQAAARAEAERILNASKIPMTAEDWRDPAKAMGKLLDK